MKSAGQATTEYLVVATALALALFVPIDGTPVAQHLLDAVARLYRNHAYLVSIA